MPYDDLLAAHIRRGLKSLANNFKVRFSGLASFRQLRLSDQTLTFGQTLPMLKGELKWILKSSLTYWMLLEKCSQQ